MERNNTQQAQKQYIFNIYINKKINDIDQKCDRSISQEKIRRNKVLNEASDLKDNSCHFFMKRIKIRRKVKITNYDLKLICTFKKGQFPPKSKF